MADSDGRHAASRQMPMVLAVWTGWTCWTAGFSFQEKGNCYRATRYRLRHAECACDARRPGLVGRVESNVIQGRAKAAGEREIAPDAYPVLTRQDAKISTVKP